MEFTPIHKRVIGLDVHQAQITACAIMEQSDGTVVIDERQFGGFNSCFKSGRCAFECP